MEPETKKLYTYEQLEERLKLYEELEKINNNLIHTQERLIFFLRLYIQIVDEELEKLKHGRQQNLFFRTKNILLQFISSMAKIFTLRKEGRNSDEMRSKKESKKNS